MCLRGTGYPPGALAPWEELSCLRRSDVPDAHGRFGPFGGRYVPETLTRALEQLTAQYEQAVGDAAFQAELAGSCTGITWAGRRRCIMPSGSAGSAAGRRST